jgi:hypothetical protein
MNSDLANNNSYFALTLVKYPVLHLKLRKKYVTDFRDHRLSASVHVQNNKSIVSLPLPVRAS